MIECVGNFGYVSLGGLLIVSIKYGENEMYSFWECLILMEILLIIMVVVYILKEIIFYLKFF